MPDVFEDTTANSYDLTITTSADWTVSSGGMPNGDNYVTGDGSIAPTYNLNGDDFNFADGTAWTVELWVYYSSSRAFPEAIMHNADAGTTTTAWSVDLGSTEELTFALANTVGGSYLVIGGGVLATGTWYHVVCVKETGNTVKMYLNNSLIGTSSSTTGTARTPTASYRLYFGTSGDGSSDITSGTSGLRVAKLAIYNAELSSGQINDHYLAMTAT